MQHPRARAVLVVALAAWAAGGPQRGARGAAIGGEERPNAPAAPARIGEEAPAFTLTDIRYLPRTLEEFGAKDAYALVFVTADCPIALRYFPRLRALDEEFRGRGVQFALIDVTPGGTIRDVATRALEHDLAFPVFVDERGGAARALGVTRSPEVVVLDAGRRVRYRGRIDDRYRLGGAKPGAAKEDLADALAAVLDGRTPSRTTTPADGCALTFGETASSGPTPTWARDVAPLLFRHCAECHRPGGEAPFSLLTFEDAAKRAAVIDEVVRQRRMPPWYGTTGSDAFVNLRGLEDREIGTIRAWAQGGAPAGDREAAPAPPPMPARLAGPDAIGEPDLVLTQLTFTSLPADGVVPYQYVVLPHVFLSDTWISACQIKASNPRVLHHANLAFFQVGEKFKTTNFITGQVPGGDAMVLDPGTAVLIPAGSVLGLQIHYVTTGKPEVDRVSVALRFPREAVKKRLHCHQVTDLRFAIPPYAPCHEVRAARTLRADSRIVGFYAHMHLRGRDMTFRATPPDGETRTLLVVPNFNFDWQQSYRYADPGLPLPAGTRFDVIAHFDNSAFNPFNPDPAATVRFGLQTTEEMMYGFVFYTEADEDLGIEVDPNTGQAREPRGH